MSETVVVRVTQGDLRGRKIITKSGLQYYSFQGIPYAAPPVGNLRFKVSIFIQCNNENQLFVNLQLHSYTSTVYVMVAMSVYQLL
jgi:carboxylesterase type B